MKLNWGIIGLGKIAKKFVSDLLLMPENHILLAVGSRNRAKAEAFRSDYGAQKAYGSYDDLLTDPAVDIIYIATPHDTHAELSIRAMKAGKHVLCEKPLAVNAKQVEEIIKVSQSSNVFIMEAFWSRFNPSISDVLARIRNGDLGEVNYVNADFTFKRNDPINSRMLNPELAGGSLLDMGVYPVFLAYSVLGYPTEIKSIGTLHINGVDLQTATILNFKNGVASLMSGFTSQSCMQAQICGTEGTIILHPTWHETQGYTFMNAQTREKEVFNRPTHGMGFTGEIAECYRCIHNDENQSDKWPLSSSLNMLKITDEIRRQVGVVYPFEK